MDVELPPSRRFGRHGVLWNAACEPLLEIIPDRFVDLVLCDPPYGMTQASWDQPLDWERVWKGYQRSLKPDGCIVLFGVKPFTFHLGATAPKGWFRYDWIWEKSKATGHLNSKRRPMRAHEEILVFSPKEPRYHPQMREGEPYDKGQTKQQREDDLYGKHHTVHVKSEDGRRFPRTTLYFKTAEAERRRYPLLHRTQKPQALLRYLIETYTQPGETVLDHCFGSCATGVAALHLDRRFIGIELNERFFRDGSDWLRREAEALAS